MEATRGSSFAAQRNSVALQAHSVCCAKYNARPLQMTPQKSERRPARWQRTILRIAAFVLLALAAADLAMPQLCGEDQPLAQSQASTLSITASSDENQPPVQQHDDCFCCCAHILAGHTFVLAVSGTHATVPQSVTAQSLPAIVHLIDLPPRAA